MGIYRQAGLDRAKHVVEGLSQGCQDNYALQKAHSSCSSEGTVSLASVTCLCKERLFEE